MSETFTSQSTVTINAPIAKVWEALTTPEQIKKYLFGTNVVTDWKVGSPIIYKGVWKDKEYEDKGTILELEPEKLLKTSYWSNLSGQPNTPENTTIVSYEVEEKEGKTVLTITTENNKTKESADHSGKNWDSVLNSLKDLLEK